MSIGYVDLKGHRKNLDEKGIFEKFIKNPKSRKWFNIVKDLVSSKLQQGVKEIRVRETENDPEYLGEVSVYVELTGFINAELARLGTMHKDVDISVFSQPELHVCLSVRREESETDVTYVDNFSVGGTI